MPPILTLVIVGGTRADLDRVAPGSLDGDEVVLLLNEGARYGGTGAIGNHALRTARGDVLGLLHADCALGPGTARGLAALALERGTLVGVTGLTPDGRHVWSKDLRDAVPAVTLDSCCVFVPVRGAAVTGVWFDAQRFDSFHCCVEDLCLLARARGLGVLVGVGPARHDGGRVFDQAWRDEFERYRERLRAKWGTGP